MNLTQQMIRDAAGNIIPQYWDGLVFQPLADNRKIKHMGFENIVELKVTATTQNLNSIFEVENISYISNDGDTELYIGFDSTSLGTTNKITLKPGEVVSNLPKKCRRLHSSCKTGTCDFRAVGVI